ncbi:MAG TPA: hypothetical protein VIU63_04965 [Nitrospira sp.]
MNIAGCAVRLIFHPSGQGRWSIEGTVHCGIEENRTHQSIQTGACASREEAEHIAINQITALLGKNTDRNTSRVRNWS